MFLLTLYLIISSSLSRSKKRYHISKFISLNKLILISAFKEVNESPEILKYIWYPELEIYGLDTFGRQKVLKEMSGVRVNRNRTITYELGLVSYPYLYPTIEF